MTIIMFVFASGMYFYCVNENVSLVLSAATPCCVKRGELQYICKQNSKPCYHIFYVQQTQDFGASIRLCCRMISVHTKYSEIWRCLQPTAITIKRGRRGGGRRPAGVHLRRPARRAQQELLWMVAAVFSDNFFTFTSYILTQSSALSTPYIFSKRHLPDITREGDWEGGNADLPTQNVAIWCPGNETYQSTVSVVRLRTTQNKS